MIHKKEFSMRHTPASNPITRREALCKMGAGFGMLSLASLLGDTIARAGRVNAGVGTMVVGGTIETI